MGNCILHEILRLKNRLNFAIFTSENCYVSTLKLPKTICSVLNSPTFRPFASPFYFSGYLEKISWLYLVFSTFYNNFKAFSFSQDPISGYECRFFEPCILEMDDLHRLSWYCDFSMYKWLPRKQKTENFRISIH